MWERNGLTGTFIFVKDTTMNNHVNVNDSNVDKSRRKVYDSFFVHRKIPIKVITVHPNHPNPPLCKSMLHAYATSLSSALVTPLLTHHWEPVYQVSKYVFVPAENDASLLTAHGIIRWYYAPVSFLCCSHPDLLAQLLVAHLLRLGLLLAQEACDPSICIAADNNARADRGLAPSDDTTLDLLDLAVEGLQHIFLALHALDHGET